VHIALENKPLDYSFLLFGQYFLSLAGPKEIEINIGIFVVHIAPDNKHLNYGIVSIRLGNIFLLSVNLFKKWKRRKRKERKKKITYIIRTVRVAPHANNRVCGNEAIGRRRGHERTARIGFEKGRVYCV
jgi:hypothetical protein